VIHPNGGGWWQSIVMATFQNGFRGAGAPGVRRRGEKIEDIIKPVIVRSYYCKQQSFLIHRERFDREKFIKLYVSCVMQ
jgi:hypothetical protein